MDGGDGDFDVMTDLRCCSSNRRHCFWLQVSVVVVVLCPMAAVAVFLVFSLLRCDALLWPCVDAPTPCQLVPPCAAVCHPLSFDVGRAALGSGGLGLSYGLDLAFVRRSLCRSPDPRRTIGSQRQLAAQSAVQGALHGKGRPKKKKKTMTDDKGAGAVTEGVASPVGPIPAE